jgi:putative flippase GtrA
VSIETQTGIAAEGQAEGRIEALRQLAYRYHLSTTFLKFLIVGGVGFLINQFGLFLLYDSPLAGAIMPAKHTHTSFGLFTHGDIRLLIASVVAVEVAIVAQFNFHDRWTFRLRNKDGNIFLRFGKYNLSSIVSPIVVIVTVNVFTPVIRHAAGSDTLIADVAPYIANTGGVLMGFIWNWTLNSLVIWPHANKPDA